MFGRFNGLLFSGIVVLLLSLFLGCSQSDDVIAPISLSEFHLKPVMLPNAPAGYLYEMWVIDTLGNSYSLGKFIWNADLYRFYDSDSSRIDSVWTVEYDILDPFYKYMAVSLETLDDAQPDTPGPIMLRDVIVDPGERELQMVVPFNFSLSTAGYCVQTPTDKQSRQKDGCGIWFAYYQYAETYYNDTTKVMLSKQVNDRQLDIANTYWDCLNIDCSEREDVTDSVKANPSYPYDTLIVDTLNLEELANTLDTVAIKCTTTVIDSFFVPDTLTMDTFIHKSMSFEYVDFPVNVGAANIDTFYYDSCLDVTTNFTIPPFKDYNHSIFYTYTTQTLLLDKFLINYEEMPDLTGSNWHYKGWVISPYLPEDCTELGRLTPPNWLKVTVDQYFTEPEEWPVITTGSFKDFSRADDGNPYSMNLRVPNFPGEDFIQNLPCGADSFYFSSQDSIYTRHGRVFITLEPDTYNENTNFPLILFTGRYTMPSYVSVSDTTTNHYQSQELQNQSSRVDNNPFGFPGIKVYIVQE
nr:hypothetical protein [candidate division Zixibacteria bacterium]